MKRLRGPNRRDTAKIVAAWAAFLAPPSIAKQIRARRSVVAADRRARLRTLTTADDPSATGGVFNNPPARNVGSVVSTVGTQLTTQGTGIKWAITEMIKQKGPWFAEFFMDHLFKIAAVARVFDRRGTRPQGPCQSKYGGNGLLYDLAVDICDQYGKGASGELNSGKGLGVERNTSTMDLPNAELYTELGLGDGSHYMLRYVPTEGLRPANLGDEEWKKRISQALNFVFDLPDPTRSRSIFSIRLFGTRNKGIGEYWSPVSYQGYEGYWCRRVVDVDDDASRAAMVEANKQSMLVWGGNLAWRVSKVLIFMGVAVGAALVSYSLYQQYNDPNLYNVSLSGCIRNTMAMLMDRLCIITHNDDGWFLQIQGQKWVSADSLRSLLYRISTRRWEPGIGHTSVFEGPTVDPRFVGKEGEEGFNPLPDLTSPEGLDRAYQGARADVLEFTQPARVFVTDTVEAAGEKMAAARGAVTAAPAQVADSFARAVAAMQGYVYTQEAADAAAAGDTDAATQAMSSAYQDLFPGTLSLDPFGAAQVISGTCSLDAAGGEDGGIEQSASLIQRMLDNTGLRSIAVSTGLFPAGDEVNAELPPGVRSVVDTSSEGGAEVSGWFFISGAVAPQLG